VARGWVPRNNLDRAVVKPYQTPSGTVQIEGMLKANSGHVYDFGMSAALHPKALIQNLQLDAFEAASHLPVYPFIVEQTGSGTEDGLLRDWPRASMGSDRHRGYAFQWLALAVMALLFFVVTSFGKRDGRKSEQQ
jgi:surfeit locus 1 family protein